MLKVLIFRFIVKLMPWFMWKKKDIPQNLNIEERSIPCEANGGEMKVRIYTPEGKGPFPIILYMHGGGWVVGSINTTDALCRDICTKSEHVIVSIDYPRAPEKPFPAAPEACLQALHWVNSNKKMIKGDGDKIYIGGDSAGGNLAAVTAIQAREKHPGLLKGQILIFPVTDHYSSGTPSYEENLKTRSLNKATMMWFWDTYLGTKEPNLNEKQYQLACPVLVKDLSNLPPAIFLMADKDPLRDEGVTYAKQLEKQGVPVKYKVYPEQEHGFIGYMGPTDAHKQGVEAICDWLGKLKPAAKQQAFINE